MPHGMHPIPATAMSAVEGLLAIVLSRVHPLPNSTYSYSKRTALSKRRSQDRLSSALPCEFLQVSVPRSSSQVRTPPFQGEDLQHTALSRRCPPVRSYSGLLARIDPDPYPQLIHALGEGKTPGHDPVYP